MEKAKKRLISSAVIAAIVAVVLCCVLIFGQSRNVVNTENDVVAVTGEQSEGMISGIYNEMSQSEAMSYYNNLSGYTPIQNQSDFDYYFESDKPVIGGMYKLKPYDDSGNKIVYTARSAAYLDSTVIDGCGATIVINSMNDITQLGDGNEGQAILNLPKGDSGYGIGTMFQYTPREVRFGLLKKDDEPVYIKVSGGFADYALGATISNINFEYTASFSRGEGDPDAASYLYGGVFGAMSVNDAGQGTTVTNCRIYNDGTFSAKKKVDGGAWVGMASRPYHATVAFGTLAGYCYNSSFTNSTVELSSTMNVYTYSVGNGQAGNNTGTPRAISAGAIGIIQNNSLVSDIYVTGSGTLNGDVGTEYYETTNSAKLGLAGALVGCVVDQNSAAEEFMITGQGDAYIKNVVSNWQGTCIMKGNVYGNNYDYTAGLTVQGAIVGISGSYINNGSAKNIIGNYFLYGDNKPDYRTVAYGNVTDKAFSYIQVIEDGANWLNIDSATRNVEIKFSENALNLIYDVSDETNTNAILWSYKKVVDNGDGSSTTDSPEFWNESAAQSYETAKKTYTLTIPNDSTVHHQYSFVTGHAVYYKVTDSEGNWTDYTDSKLGNDGVRTYNVMTKSYDSVTVPAPDVQLYYDKSLSNYVNTSTDANQWAVQKMDKGSLGSFINVGDAQTKNIGQWYFSMRTDIERNTNYSYYANINNVNYVAYKLDNQEISSQEDVAGTAIALRYYVYDIVPKQITPIFVAKSADELIYDNTAKIYDVDFGSEIYSGDVVTPTLNYFSMASGEESSVESVVNAGDYRVKITALSNSNYELSENIEPYDFTVTKRELYSSITSDSGFVYVYNGLNQTPQITVSNQLANVDQSAVVSVSYSKDGGPASNISAGEYTVSVSLTSGARQNYVITGDLEKTFIIQKAQLTYTGAYEYSFVYDSMGIGYETLLNLQENPISIGNPDVYEDGKKGYECGYSVYFRDYVEGDDTLEGYDPSEKTKAGVYDCLIESNATANYEQLYQKIKITITPATVTFNITPQDGTPEEDGSYNYDGNDVSFKVSHPGIGYRDEAYINFVIKIYPATYDSESAKWVASGTEGVASVRNAGNYIAVIEQTLGADIDENTNYVISDASVRELPFTINKATLIWQFSGTGLNYDEASGEYWAEYNGETFTLSLESGDLDSQLVENDRGKYTLTGGVEYFCVTAGGTYSVGTSGVRDAGNYLVVPEVEYGENDPELPVNYEILGGDLIITQRIVTIVVSDISLPYGTEIDFLSEETFASMWRYELNSKHFIESDGQMLTFIWTEENMPEHPVRGNYPYEFVPSYVNPNSINYDIRRVYTAGDNSNCTITGLELKVEVVVTDNNGNEVGVYPFESVTSGDVSALYYGGEYTVSLRAVNIEDGNPDVEWLVDSYSFVNNADSDTVTFTLTEESNKIYFIGNDLSALKQPDGIFNVNFTVDKREVELTVRDTDVEYGIGNDLIAFEGADVTGGDGFVDGEQDWFKYSYTTNLGANVGSTAEITVSVASVAEHSGAENNYNFVCTAGNATRVAKVLHVTLINRERTYGSDPLSAGAGDYTVAESLVGDDTLDLVYELSKDGETVVDAYNLAVGTYALSAKSSDTNYEIVVIEGATYDVDPKAVNVTLSSVSKSYDATSMSVGINAVEGLITGDEDVEPVITYYLNGVPVAGDPVNIGVYTVTVDGFTSDNYVVGTVTGQDATVEITKIAVNVTVNDAVMAYGTGVMTAADGGSIFTSDNATFNSDDLQPAYQYTDTGAPENLVPGTYEGVLTVVFNGEAANNYQINIGGNAALTVTVADLSEVAYLEEYESFYDGNAKTLTVKGVLEDQVEIVITKDGSVAETVLNAGEYKIDVMPGNSYYTGQASFTYVVKKAAIDATLDNTSSVYDGNVVVPEVNEKYGDVIFKYELNGEEVSEIRNAGVYTVTITASPSSNYTGSTEAVYTVEKADTLIPDINDIKISKTWNGITVTDVNGHEVLISLDRNDWTDASDTLEGLDPATLYTVFVKFANDDNYNEMGVLSVPVETDSMPALDITEDDFTFDVYYNEIVIGTELEGDVMYSIDGGKTWVKGNKISGLKAEEEYTVYVKIGASASQGESKAIDVTLTTGADPAAFNEKFNSMGESVMAADLDKYTEMMEEYNKLSDGDKAKVDSAKLEKLQTAYNELIGQVNGDIIAAQNVARKAAGKGAAAAAASVLAAVAVAIIAKKKFVF